MQEESKIYSTSEIAKLENLSTDIVRKWARVNSLNRISDNEKGAYYFTKQDYLNFQNRCKKVGKRAKKK